MGVGKRSERNQTAPLLPTSVPQALVQTAETGGGQETVPLREPWPPEGEGRMRAPDLALQAPRRGGERSKATAITCSAHILPSPQCPLPRLRLPRRLLIRSMFRGLWGGGGREVGS